MGQYVLPYFGQVNPASLNESYRTVIDLKGNNIRIDLNLKNSTLDNTQMDVIKKFTENIAYFDNQNKAYIIKDFESVDGETSDYINFYLEELDDEELSTIINFADTNTTKEKQLLTKLKLVRIGLYPDGKYGSTNFGTFDYSIYIDGQPCNQLLVVNTDEHGNLKYITWES